MITAHGASERRLAAVRERGLHVLDATCFLVRTAHSAVMTMAREGLHPVIVGRRDHVEVRGLTEDLDEFDVVLDEEDVGRLAPQARFGVVAQTTQPVERVQRLASLIRQRFPDAEVRVADTVCAPTKRRQAAALELARRCDVVIVIGGARSNNTRELAGHLPRRTARGSSRADRGGPAPRVARRSARGRSHGRDLHAGSDHRSMSRRGCGRSLTAGWQRRPVCG